VLNFDEFLSALQEQLDIPTVEGLSQDTDLYEDLGLDSLQTFELVYVTDGLAGLDESQRTSDADVFELTFDPIMTLGDAYAYYQRILDNS